jgi:hypothetical protein
MTETRFPGIVEHRFERELRFEHVGVSLFLPTVMRDRLAEISVTIKKSDGDERDVQIARDFK